MIAGVEPKVPLTEIADSSPEPPKAVATSPAPAPPEPEFSVVAIPNCEISAATEVTVATNPAPTGVRVTAPQPVKFTDSVNGWKSSIRILQIHLSGSQLTEIYKFSPSFKFQVLCGRQWSCMLLRLLFSDHYYLQRIKPRSAFLRYVDDGTDNGVGGGHNGGELY